jgi:hypothetical protein
MVGRNPIGSHMPLPVRHVLKELVEKIETLWDDASDCAHLTKFQSDILRKSTILSEGIFFE